MTVIDNQLVALDGTRYDAALQPIEVPGAALVAEERDRAADLSAELRRRVMQHEANRPRSQQTKLGPSEVGTPCLRQLAYKAVQHPRVNSSAGDRWPSFVGTAVHAALDEVFSGTPDEYLTEQRVVVDADLDLAGSTDLVKLRGGVTAIDHKVVAATTMTKVKRHGPPAHYVTQVNAYAHGLIATGVPVEWVAIAYWPAGGRLSDGPHVWLQRYDQTVVDVALAKLDTVRKLHARLGPALFAHLPTAEHYCTGCPFYSPHAVDPATSCAGHQETTP